VSSRFALTVELLNTFEAIPSNVQLSLHCWANASDAPLVRRKWAYGTRPVDNGGT